MKEKTPMRKHSDWLNEMMERYRETAEDHSLDPFHRRKAIGHMLAYRDAWKESLKMLKEESEVIERAFNANAAAVANNSKIIINLVLSIL
jgi:hypothetical protein